MRGIITSKGLVWHFKRIDVKHTYVFIVNSVDMCRLMYLRFEEHFDYYSVKSANLGHNNNSDVLQM